MRDMWPSHPTCTGTFRTACLGRASLCDRSIRDMWPSHPSHATDTFRAPTKLSETCGQATQHSPAQSHQVQPNHGPPWRRAGRRAFPPSFAVRRLHGPNGVQSLKRPCGNDPSAGSPTETLLRLLLPLNATVWSSSRQPGRVIRQANSPRTSLKRSIGSSDGRCVQRAGT